MLVDRKVASKLFKVTIMNIKQEPPDDNTITIAVKSEAHYQHDGVTNPPIKQELEAVIYNSNDFQFETVKQEEFDIDAKPPTASREDKSVTVKCATCRAIYNLKRSFIERSGINVTGESFMCGFCEYKTGKQYTCSICKYQAPTPSQLARHMMVHSGEKPFVCSVCGYRAAHKYNITIHMRKHTGEKHYECNYCDYKSLYNSTMKRHVRAHQKIHS